MKPFRPPALSLPRPAWIAGLILLAGAALSLVVNWPGHLSYDSVVQLEQGRSGLYNAWHPPVMAWLLGLSDAVSPGAALFVVFDGLLIFGSLVSLALMAGRGAWAAPIAALILAALPQVLIYPGIVWKDVLFAGSALAGFTCLAWAAQLWRRTPLRWIAIGKAAVLLSLAALARQNGVVILPVAAVALGWIVARQGQSPMWRRGLAHAALFAAATALLTLGAGAALKTRTDGHPERVHQFEDLRIYEIVAARDDDPHRAFPILAAKAPALNAFLTGPGARLYTPQRIDPLVQTPDVQLHEDRDAPFVQAQWNAIFLSDPLLYLKVRARLFGWVLLTPDVKACVPVAIGVNGPPDLLAKLKIDSRYSDMDDALLAYASAFFATPVFSHLLFAAVAVVLLIGLLIRRRPPDIAMAGLLAAALTFTATFFAITIACDYRYLYFLDLSALAGGLYAAGSVAWGRKV